MIGPLFINYMFITETTGWDINLAFSAGDMLQYYGAVLGGIVTCFAIITTVRINSSNRRSDLRRQKFERAYAIYHKLPDILTKLEMAAIHVQYSVHLPEEKLIETFDTMKESENVLREYHFANGTFYSKDIESLLIRLLTASDKCQKSVEVYLREENSTDKDRADAHRAMEDAFVDLRELLNNTKSKIMSTINQFISVYDDKT
ncbi:MAG: hypothetical protein FWH57_09100 [Oscillospiraceae bacterium]|nr:hypothetical protein [Oscillospiraceae bacterium]